MNIFAYSIMFPAGCPVATYDYALAHARLVRRGQLAAASPGLEVRRSPTFDGEPSGRVCEGVGHVMDHGNVLGCIAVWWPDVGDRTTWTRASDGKYDVVTTGD